MTDSVQTLASSTVKISAGLPTTIDTDASTGFPSLTFTTVTEVVEVPTYGRTYNLVTHMPVSSREVSKYKGSFNNGSTTITMARDDDDAGQVICLAAAVADASYSFEVTFQDGSKDYFTAKVMSFPAVGGNSDTIAMRQMALEIDSNVVSTAAV